MHNKPCHEGRSLEEKEEGQTNRRLKASGPSTRSVHRYVQCLCQILSRFRMDPYEAWLNDFPPKITKFDLLRRYVLYGRVSISLSVRQPTSASKSLTSLSTFLTRWGQPLSVVDWILRCPPPPPPSKLPPFWMPYSKVGPANSMGGSKGDGKEEGSPKLIITFWVKSHANGMATRKSRHILNGGYSAPKICAPSFSLGAGKSFDSMSAHSTTAEVLLTFFHLNSAYDSTIKVLTCTCNQNRARI